MRKTLYSIVLAASLAGCTHSAQVPEVDSEELKPNYHTAHKGVAKKTQIAPVSSTYPDLQQYMNKLSKQYSKPYIALDSFKEFKGPSKDDMDWDDIPFGDEKPHPLSKDNKHADDLTFMTRLSFIDLKQKYILDQKLVLDFDTSYDKIKVMNIEEVTESNKDKVLVKNKALYELLSVYNKLQETASRIR